jgi:beta-N-acetylhexosaminidase
MENSYHPDIYSAARDEAAVHHLWQQVLGESWPIERSRLQLVLNGPDARHFVVYEGGRLLGFAATQQGMRDSALRGQLLALIVDPAFQGRGVGSALHDAALAHLRGNNVDLVRLGGLVPRFWCGLPTNLAAAKPFFEHRGWDFEDVLVHDMVGDLHAYVTPVKVQQRIEQEGVLFETATPESIAEVLAFEQREFPNWVMHFERGARLDDYSDILIARDPHKGIVGALFMYSQRSNPTRTDLVWQSLLGEDAGAFGAVGVAASERGRGIGIAICARASELLKERGVGRGYIDWLVLTDFYGKLGYEIWRSYWTAKRRF